MQYANNIELEVEQVKTGYEKEMKTCLAQIKALTNENMNMQSDLSSLQKVYDKSNKQYINQEKKITNLLQELDSSQRFITDLRRVKEQLQDGELRMKQDLQITTETYSTKNIGQ